jgi:hypothetical protein
MEVDIVRTGLLPQELFALTESVPPAIPVVVVNIFVDEVPLHPEGNVQVYDNAPETGVTE